MQSASSFLVACTSLSCSHGKPEHDLLVLGGILSQTFLLTMVAPFVRRGQLADVFEPEYHWNATAP
jgi:hypothetical protein